MSEPTTAAPQTHKQSSRKGKRAWRKNVDITDIQSGIQEAREQITLTGGKLLADLDASDLFQTDITGSAQLKSQARKAHPLLKADEIIAQRSAVPAVNSRKRPASDSNVTDGVLVASKRRRADGVSHKELERLKQLAYGGETVHKDVVSTDGTATYDPWAIIPAAPIQADATYLDPIQPIREPKTVHHAPLSLTSSGKPLPSVRIPSGGRSYNPAFADWTALLTQEGEKELRAEKKRLELAQAEAERLERVAAQTAEAERAELREAALSEVEESEWEGIQSDMEDSQLRRKRPERKTPSERNKINRRKEAERQTRHDRRMKERDEQVKRLAAIRRELDARDAAKKAAATTTTTTKFAGSVQSDSEEEDQETGEALRRRRFGRTAIPAAPLELVLADELQESLRLLKPEGNLLSERFRNLLVQGKVEARNKIWQPKKARRKATEKWGYKDWKLPRRT